MTDTGLVYPDNNGTVIIHGQGLTKIIAPNPISLIKVGTTSIMTIDPDNQLDFTSSNFGTNYIDVHFTEAKLIEICEDYDWRKNNKDLEKYL